MQHSNYPTATPPSIADDGGCFETALPSRPEGRAPALDARAAEINSLHDDILSHARTSLEKAIELGGLLTEVKRSIPHGSFLPWLSSNVTFGRSTAANYVRCFENRVALRAKLAASEFETFSDALSLLAAPKNPNFPKKNEKCAMDCTFETVAQLQANIAAKVDAIDPKRAQMLALVQELRTMVPAGELRTQALAAFCGAEPEAWQVKFVDELLAEVAG